MTQLERLARAAASDIATTERISRLEGRILTTAGIASIISRHFKPLADDSTEARCHVALLVSAMARWGNEEDGIPEEFYANWQNAKRFASEDMNSSREAAEAARKGKA